MPKRWVWGIVLGTFTQLYAAPARAQCSKDTDCKGDRICSAGECTAPQPVPQAAAAPQPAPPAPPPPGGAALAPSAGLAESSSAPVVYERKSTGLMVAGIVVGGAGLVTLVTGIGFGVASSHCRNDLGDKYAPSGIPTLASDELDHCQSQADTSTALVLTGSGLTIAGVLMFVVGGRNVPVSSSGARLTPWLGTQSGGLTLRLSL